MKKSKFIDYLLGFLALIGIGSLLLKKKGGNPTAANKEVDAVKKEIEEEVNETPTTELVADYNKRHGKS